MPKKSFTTLSNRKVLHGGSYIWSGKVHNLIVVVLPFTAVFLRIGGRSVA